MQVNLNQLRCFYYAVKHNSVSKAAEELFVTPPAITMQIKKLEEWLGFRLLCRRKNGIQLAEGVQSLYDQAKKIFDEVEIIEQDINRMMKKDEQELRIGSHYIPAKYIMPKLMAHIRQFYPQMNVKVILGSVPSLMEQVRNKELHFCLSAASTPEPKIKKVSLFAEELLFVAARDSKRIKKSSITVDELKRLPLLLPEKGTPVFDILFAYFESVGIIPCVEMDNISADIVKNFVLQDMGLAFLARFTIQDKLETGELKEIQIIGGPPVAEFCLAYYAETPLTPFVEKVVTSLKETPFNLGRFDQPVTLPSCSNTPKIN